LTPPRPSATGSENCAADSTPRVGCDGLRRTRRRFSAAFRSDRFGLERLVFTAKYQFALALLPLNVLLRDA
jgi:hypothetical protein